MLTAAPVQKLRKALETMAFIGATKRSREFSARSARYFARQYDDLEDWSDEGRLEDKAPNLRIRLTKIAIDQINAHLFGVDKKPRFEVESPTSDEGEDDDGEEDDSDLGSRVSELYGESGLRRQLPEVGRLGNLHGTVGVGFHVVEGEIDVEIIHAADSRPTFGRDDRRRAARRGIDFDDLLELDERWLEVDEDPTTGEETRVLHRRRWTPDRTVEYEPIELEGDEVEDAEDLTWIPDDDRTTEHGLGFVPVEWIKNLPLAHDIDGQAIVGDAEFDLEDEINYQLSQTGRALRYNQEPQPYFKNVDGVSREETIRRGSKNPLNLMGASRDAEPDVGLLEMDGAGTDAALDYVDQLSRFFREATKTIRHDPEKLKGALSGVALKRLLRPLIGVVGEERAQYGPKLARLLEKMVAAVDGDEIWGQLSPSWPAPVELTPQERLQAIQAALRLYRSGLATKRKAVELVSSIIDVEDVDAFLEKLEAEEARNAARGTQPAPEDVARDAESDLEGL